MRRLITILLALLVLAGCGGSDEKAAAPESSAVRELANVLELRSDFEADAGKTRLLVLLSPT